MFWPASRLIVEGIATRRDLETWYSVDDVLDDNDALDAKAEAERKLHDRMRKAAR